VVLGPLVHDGDDVGHARFGRGDTKVAGAIIDDEPTRTGRDVDGDGLEVTDVHARGNDQPAHETPHSAGRGPRRLAQQSASHSAGR